MRKRLVEAIVFVLILGLLIPSGVSAQSISVSVDAGHYTSDTILTETPIIFMLRYQNPDPALGWMISNGYRVYSPDGAAWRGPSLIDSLPGVLPPSAFDLAHATIFRHGSTADTFGVLGAFLLGSGLPPNFDGFPYAIRIGGFETNNSGLHVCLDSSFFPPANTWKWVSRNGTSKIEPSWGGPYCYTVYNLPCGQLRGSPSATTHCGCCFWTTGNVDGDPADLADISDIVALVDFLSTSLPLSSCAGENDVDRSGEVDISDLMLLIDNIAYGVLLPPCPFGA